MIELVIRLVAYLDIKIRRQGIPYAFWKFKAGSSFDVATCENDDRGVSFILVIHDFRRCEGKHTLPYPWLDPTRILIRDTRSVE